MSAEALQKHGQRGDNLDFCSKRPLLVKVSSWEPVPTEWVAQKATKVPQAIYDCGAFKVGDPIPPGQPEISELILS
jgi:hypothetical protein